MDRQSQFLAWSYPVGVAVVCSLRHICIVLLMSLVLVSVSSCQQKKQTSNTKTLSEAIDPILLHRDLRLQMDNSLAEIMGTASDIAASTQDRQVREKCLLWKIRAYDAYQRILTISDPRAAFLFEWMAVIQLRQYLTEGDGKDIFGPAQPKAIAVAQAVEAEIITLGKKHFKADTIEAATDDIEQQARRFSKQSEFMSEPDPRVSQGDRDILKILQLPLLPVRSLESVSSTPNAISRFTDTTQDFTTVIKQLPERTRWQLELLQLEMESSGPVAALNQRLDRLDQDLRDMITLVKTMPSDNKLKDTAEGFTETAKAFEAAAIEIRKLLADYQQIPSNSENTGKSSSGVEDYRKAAESITNASQELRLLLAELRQPVDEQNGMRQIAKEGRDLINTLFWRAALLFVVVFVLALGYRWIVTKFIQIK